MGSSACQAALASVHSDGAAYRELLLRLGEAPEHQAAARWQQL